MHHGDQFVGFFRQLFLYRIHNDRRSPVKFQDVHISIQAGRHILHALAKHPVDQDQHWIIFFNKVHKTAFHAGGTGSGNRKSQCIPGVKQGFELVFDGIHDLDEIRVQMP